MRSETKFTYEKKSNDNISQGKQRISNITNDSQTLRLSELSDSINEIEKQKFSIFQNNNILFKKLFEEKVKQQEITSNLHRKAINWLITFCWTKNYNQDILWYSVGFYYSYFYSTLIKKQKLTLILISAVNLALKLYESNSAMGFQTLKKLMNDAFTFEEFRQVQEQFTQLFEFDFIYPTLLGQIYRLDRSEQQVQKVLFIAQTLFMNNYQSAINDLLLQDILILINTPQCENGLRNQIQKLFRNMKTAQPLKQKFSSKFNIDQFLQKTFKS